MEDKKNKRNIIIIVIIILLIGFLVGGYFLFFNDSKDDNDDTTKTSESVDSSIVVSKNFEYAIDDIGNLLIVSDIKLSEALPSDKVINIYITSYDTEGKILHKYLASSRDFDIDGLKEIHMAFDDYEYDENEGMTKLETKVLIEERTIDPRHDYEFVQKTNPEVVYFVSLYRIFMDLSDYYYDNSGTIVVDYADGEKLIKRISYLDDTDYIGLSEEKDFSKNDTGASIDKVSVYRFGYIWKQE